MASLKLATVVDKVMLSFINDYEDHLYVSLDFNNNIAFHNFCMHCIFMNQLLMFRQIK